MKLSGPSILGILSASNVVPRSRERERVVADRVRDVGGKAFLGGGDRGEVSNPVNQKTEVNTIHQFLHQASLLIPAEFAETPRQN
jgi:hypothetical protein